MRPPLSPPPQTQSHPDNPPSSPSSTKRPLSPSHEDTTTAATTNGQDAKRRRVSSEQARGKRMFGALMGTLNSFQKQVSRGSKLAKQVERRAEIDARVKERVAKEKDEMDAAKEREEREKKELEDSHRFKLEAETKRLQNSSEMAKARHLYTECSPRIYFRPYILLPDQSTLIELQVAQAEGQIDADTEDTTLARRDDSGKDGRLDETDVREERNSSASPPKDGEVGEDEG